MQLIDGKALAATLRADLKAEIAAQRLTPKLGVLLVGADPASEIYVNLKQRAALETGILVDLQKRPENTSDEELKSLIESWNKDETVDGILIQLPLPANHDTNALIALIDPKKDADGFHPQSLTSLYNGEAKIFSPVHESILRLIGATGTGMNTSHVTVIANSDIFSKPLEYLLRKSGAFVTIMSPDELDRKTLLTSNVIIIAVGREKLLNRSHIAPGTVVIDVGTNRTADGKVVGDVDAENIKELSGWLTPVPGGVGPMTIAVLLKNVVTLARLRRGV